MAELTIKQIVLIAYGAYLILLSIITFIAYGADKKKAKDGKYRSEPTRQLNYQASGLHIG